MIKNSNSEQQKNNQTCPLCKISDETIKNLKESDSFKKKEYILKKQRKDEKRLARVRRRNIKKFFVWALLVLLVSGLIVFALGGLGQNKNQESLAKKTKITVFLSPTCSCCQDYISYLKRGGFKVEKKEVRDMLSVKEQYKIPSEMESCHTSVVDNYFIEGHVPIEAVNKLLSEKPEIDGIAIPGMPSGSPGMGGIKTGPFEIYKLSNGKYSEFFSL